MITKLEKEIEGNCPKCRKSRFVYDFTEEDGTRLYRCYGCLKVYSEKEIRGENENRERIETNKEKIR